MRRAARVVVSLAAVELRRWLRSPVLVVCALVPAAAFALLVAALTAAVGRQPVALVVEGHSPLALRLADAVRTSDGFLLTELDAAAAAQAMREQRVAAVITVPASVDDLAHRPARLDVLVNNVDLDFADDVRRSATEAVVEVDAPALATLGESDREQGTVSGAPNPYRVDVAEIDLRRPDVPFAPYQLVAVLGLLAVTAGTVVTAVSLAVDVDSGVVAVQALSPGGGRALVAGRVAGGALAAGALTVGAATLALLLWRMPVPVSRLAPVATALVLTAVAATALGVLVGAVSRTVPGAVLGGVNVAAGGFLLGGGFSTLAFLPDLVQSVAALLPTSYCVRSVRELLFYAEPRHVASDLLVLAGYAVVAASLGAAVLRRRAAGAP